jgi:diphthamide synthase (EF-2-diphthine--ammonia ligase)
VALERALHHFLKAKLKIETSELNKDKIAEILLERGIEKDDIKELIQLLEHCDMARYSPISAGEIQTDYQQSIATITKLDKKI